MTAAKREGVFVVVSRGEVRYFGATDLEHACISGSLW
jgi:hypothetical protein